MGIGGDYEFSLNVAFEPWWDVGNQVQWLHGGMSVFDRGKVFRIYAYREGYYHPDTPGKLEIWCGTAAMYSTYHNWLLGSGIDYTHYHNAVDELTTNSLVVREAAGNVEFVVNGTIISTVPGAFTDITHWVYVDVGGGLPVTHPEVIRDFDPPIWIVDDYVADDGEPYTDWLFVYGSANCWDQPERKHTLPVDTWEGGSRFWKQFGLPHGRPEPPEWRGDLLRFGRGLAALYDPGTTNTHILRLGTEDVLQARGAFRGDVSSLGTTIFSAGSSDTALNLIQQSGRKYGFFARDLTAFGAYTNDDALDAQGDGIADYTMGQITTWDGYALLDVATSLDGHVAYAVMEKAGTALHFSRCSNRQPSAGTSWSTPVQMVTGLAGTAAARVVDYGARLTCFYQVGTGTTQAISNFEDGVSGTWA